MKQTELMRLLNLRIGRDRDAVCEEYARAEERGEVLRKSNKNGLTASQYARALYRDGERKGWFTRRHLSDGRFVG
jgi:hypothetical protein